MAVGERSSDTKDWSGDTRPEFESTDPKNRTPAGAVAGSGIVGGRYELLELLSQGGMGRVFKARHVELGRIFALKLVLPGISHDAEIRSRFFREARAMSALHHVNITSVTDFGLDEALGYFLVMELLEGETLRQRLDRGRVPVRFACDVLDQVATAVRYMHARQVLHCDLKPENIFLTRVEGERRQNVIKLLDFGLSATRGDAQAKVSGTVPYLAPERLRGEPPSEACDVYSMGMVLYEMIAGAQPFSGSDVEIMDQQITGAVPPPPSRFAKESVDERGDELLLRSLAANPGKRQPSAEAFHYELRAFMQMMGLRARRTTGVGVTTGVHAILPEQSVIRETFEAQITASPLPLALFEPDGRLRFANTTFLLAAEGAAELPLHTWGALRIARRQPDLATAFRQAVDEARPVYRMVVVGAEGDRPMLLVLSPKLRRDRVESVHATFVDAAFGR